MKKREWNEGMNHLDPDIVEKYTEQKDRIRKKKKQKHILLRFGAIAACFVLIVSAIIVVPMLREDDSEITTSPDATDHTPIVFDATVSPEKLNGSNSEFIVGPSVSVGGGFADLAPPKFEFDTSAFVVKARVVVNHPDLYNKLDVYPEYKPNTYRLIQMESLEVLHGENVPQYFLYLIPNALFIDMSVYDSLMISMIQLGTENYVLKNGTKNQMESFELPIFVDYQEHPELGNIIAFSDGVFDESLWQKESWKYGYQFGVYYLDNPEAGDLVVMRGDTDRDVVKEIKSRIEELKEWLGDQYQVPTPLTLHFSTQVAKDAIEYVKPFENGVFSQDYAPYVGNGQLIFRRFINGCQTEETITIDLLTEEVTYSEVKYTKEDMSCLENIAVHLAEKAKEYSAKIPTPPHTDTKGKELLCLNVYAWYVKVDGNLYGVIKTCWRYKDKDNWYVQYYDDSYILYDMTESTAVNISRDDLVNIVGTRNVYSGQYGSGIVMPMA